jgi:hypothetical protein
LPGQRVNGDDELRSEVETRLSRFDHASSFIEQPLYESGKNALLSSLLDDADEDPMIGAVLGNCKIERAIGRGGMGAVYAARRCGGFGMSARYWPRSITHSSLASLTAARRRTDARTSRWSVGIIASKCKAKENSKK